MNDNDDVLCSEKFYLKMLSVSFRQCLLFSKKSRISDAVAITRELFLKDANSSEDGKAIMFFPY